MYIVYNLIVKVIFLLLHKLDADRQYIEILPYLVTECFSELKPGGIFLSSDNQLRRWHCSKGLVDELDVLLLKLMMVAEGQRHEVWR